MFKDLVAEFEKKIPVSAGVYIDGKSTTMSLKFLAGMSIELSGAIEFPPYILLTGEGVYLDKIRQHKIPEQEGVYYNIFRVYDPRVLVKGFLENTLEEEVPGRWGAEYDPLKLGLVLSAEHLNIPEWNSRQKFWFDQSEGNLERITFAPNGSLLTISFNYDVQ